MRNPTTAARRRPAFSLIELLVVIVILAILLALIFAAVQQARESANKVVCANNLQQMALAANSHVSLYGRYPSGGWGWGWVGDPDQGTGTKQPGGWIYNLLPFMEYRNVHDMGKGMPPAAKKAAIAQRCGITLKPFNCPTRRNGGPYPNTWGYTYGEIGYAPPLEARTDYAANIGDNSMDEYMWGPPDLQTGMNASWSGWHDTSSLTGITFERSWIRPSDITKGISNVYLYGEKYLRADDYDSSKIWDGADNENMYCGMDNDICRDTAVQPFRDTPGVSNTFAFGSAHRDGFCMSYCDGSVRWVSFRVSMAVHTAAGNRH